MNNLRITLIADKQEQVLISDALNVGLKQPEISAYESREEFDKAVKLHNCDFIIAQENLLNRSFYSHITPFLELTKIPLLVLKDADSVSVKNRVVKELTKDADNAYLQQLAPLNNPTHH